MGRGRQTWAAGLPRAWGRARRSRTPSRRSRRTRRRSRHSRPSLIPVWWLCCRRDRSPVSTGRMASSRAKASGELTVSWTKRGSGGAWAESRGIDAALTRSDPSRDGGRNRDILAVCVRQRGPLPTCGHMTRPHPWTRSADIPLAPPRGIRGESAPWPTTSAGIAAAFWARRP
jgi:hypothetical protein